MSFVFLTVGMYSSYTFFFFSVKLGRALVVKSVVPFRLKID